MDVALHTKRARKAWRYLVRRARKQRPPFTYKEIGEKVGVHWRVAGLFLGIIQSYCQEKKLPKLQALAVNSITKVPGHGYIGCRGKAQHARELQAVYRRQWQDKAPF
jgi:hypothetical protein